MLMKSFKKDGIFGRIYSDRKGMGKAAANRCADFLKRVLKEKGEATVIFAAAPSQNETLLYLTRKRGIDWSKVRALHMDEYVGLDKSSQQSFGYFLNKAIFEKVGFKEVLYISEKGLSSQELCDRYSEILKKYPPDIVCLGIGSNGHIAFNDPHVADFNDSKLVKVVDLDEKCRNQQVADGCFPKIEDVPKYAITLTIPAMTSAKYLICTVPAELKAEAVYNTVNGEINEKCPATVMRKHQNAYLYLDTDSAKFLFQK